MLPGFAISTMLNKLIFGKNKILQPLLESLKSTSDDSGVSLIRELEELLLQNSEQRHTLQKLMAQGYLDQIVFTKQKNEFMTQAQAYQSEIDILQRTGGDHQGKINELNKLLYFAERSEMLIEFADELFTDLADHIIVYSRNEIGISLKCGLLLEKGFDL